MIKMKDEKINLILSNVKKHKFEFTTVLYIQINEFKNLEKIIFKKYLSSFQIYANLYLGFNFFSKSIALFT
jgi:hypothetical protein